MNRKKTAHRKNHRKKSGKSRRVTVIQKQGGVTIVASGTPEAFERLSEHSK
jgi:hypothetical protein